MKKVNYLDIASVISAISVVILHTNGVFWQFSKENYWISSNIIECIFYFAVPVFFMISGATLLNFYDRYNLKRYFHSRIKKTVIPYLFWTFFAIFFRLYITKEIVLSQLTLSEILTIFLTGGGVNVYWFFIPLFCIYLSIPLLASVKEEKRKEVFSYLAITGFVINILLPFINSVFNLEIRLGISVNIISGYLIFLIIGYLLHNYEINNRLTIAIYFLGILGLLLHIVGTYYHSIEIESVSKLYKGYANLPSILYSTAVFLLFKNFGKKLLYNNKIEFIIMHTKKYTFSIYLLHFYIITLIGAYVNKYSIVWRLFGFIPIMVIVIIITFFIRKTRVGKIILP